MINDKNQLKAFAGCFGLAGIVTSITFKMDKMTWAKFHPKKTRMADSIPRPDGDTNSEVLSIKYASVSTIKQKYLLCRLTKRW